ncbi:FadR/GntR family transcriptional regulator [Corticibacterium sp. UT-5YL-CI-8]|nr:FadR/GntR family transcriptional regulator [Tianweitania sp. UT-5YL-CI-8]
MTMEIHQDDADVEQSGASEKSAGRTPSKAPKLVDKVFEQLQERITLGEFPSGSKLPGEHDLATLLGVSRPVVRDALGRLREVGLVYSRQGSGTYVRVFDAQKTSLGFSPVKTIADIQRCYEFRLTIEPEAAFFAAQRHDDASLMKIRAALAELRDATRDQTHRADVDFVFHRSVAEAANNHYYTACLDALRQHIAVGMKLHGLSLMGPLIKLEQVYDEHSDICDAIAGGQAELARTRMYEHLEGSRNRLFENKVLDLSR